MNLFGNMKYLSKNIRYESLQDFENSMLKIDISKEDLSIILRREIEESLSFKLGEYVGNDILKVINKYGYLDLVYLLENVEKPDYRENGFELLKRYGIFQKPENGLNEKELEERREVFEIFFSNDVEQMKLDNLYFKLFAQVGNGPQDWYKLKYRKNIFGKLKEKEVKQVKFQIIDACITNFKGIWSNKYLYL